MNINILLKELSKLVFFAFNKKKILFFWLFMYILGLPLIYTYKSIYYEYDYKVRISKQYLPIETNYSRGIDPLLFELIKKNLINYDLYHNHNVDEDFMELNLTIVKPSKEEIDNEIKDVKSILENFKIKVAKLSTDTLLNYEKELKYFDKIDIGERERVEFFNTYLMFNLYHNLFIEIYIDEFIKDNYKFENIKSVKVNLIIKIFSFYIFIFYILNLLILILLKNHREKEFA